mgnify:CR=1 FL=1
MIDLYTFGTPNGRKVSITLEEMELDYEVHSINIQKDEQFGEAFLKISPNNKIPAIVDHETGVSMMESGAILYYLATKTGKFMPKDPLRHWQAIEWLNWQMGGFGPMAGQAHHFLQFNPGKAPYAETRYATEVQRLYGVLDKQLEGQDFICGDYSIADMACWPWVARYEWQRVDLTQFPNVLRWYKALRARDAVIKGYQVPKDVGEVPRGEP